MVAPTKAFATLVQAVLDKSDEVAAQLEDVVAANPTATTQFVRPDFTKTEQIPKPESDIDSNDLLDVIQSKLDVARAADDVAAVKRLIEEGKAVLVREFMAREKALAEAQAAYDKALDEFTAAGPVTIEAGRVLEQRKNSFADYESFIPEQEAYYDSLIEEVDAPQEAPDERLKIVREVRSIFESLRSPRVYDQMYELQGKLEEAVAAVDESQAVILLQKCKDAVRAAQLIIKTQEIPAMEKKYQEIFKEYGPTAAITREAKVFLHSTKGAIDDMVADFDEEYDEIFSRLHALKTKGEYSLEELRKKTREELLNIFDTAVATYKARIQEIEAEEWKKVMASIPDDKQKRMNEAAKPALANIEKAAAIAADLKKE